jgi:hypothetical protein
MTDLVNHPPHYTAGRFEAIDVIEDAVAQAPRRSAWRLPVAGSEIPAAAVGQGATRSRMLARPADIWTG